MGFVNALGQQNDLNPLNKIKRVNGGGGEGVDSPPIAVLGNGNWKQDRLITLYCSTSTPTGYHHRGYIF